jgi:hypothetical protein
VLCFGDHVATPCVRRLGCTLLQVRFTCRADAKDDMVMSVKEFPTCNYVVMVSALNLCNHAAFKPRVRATASVFTPGIHAVGTADTGRTYTAMHGVVPSPQQSTIESRHVPDCTVRPRGAVVDTCVNSLGCLTCSRSTCTTTLHMCFTWH